MKVNISIIFGHGISLRTSRMGILSDIHFCAAEPRRNRRVLRRRETRRENERNEQVKFRWFASLDTFAWSACRRQLRFSLLDEARRRGHKSEDGGAARKKKVYRLQRSEKLRFRSQHRRHSSVPSFPRVTSFSAFPTCIPPRPQPQESEATVQEGLY